MTKTGVRDTTKVLSPPIRTAVRSPPHQLKHSLTNNTIGAVPRSPSTKALNIRSNLMTDAVKGTQTDLGPTVR